MWLKLWWREESWVNISLPHTIASRSLRVVITIVWATWSCTHEFGCSVGIPIGVFLFWLRKWGFWCVAATSSLGLRTFFIRSGKWELSAPMCHPVLVLYNFEGCIQSHRSPVTVTFTSSVMMGKDIMMTIRHVRRIVTFYTSMGFVVMGLCVNLQCELVHSPMLQYVKVLRT